MTCQSEEGTMNRQWKLLTAALTLLSTVLFFSVALAGESANYRSYPQVLDNGGGKPASPTYQARASIGQHVIGPSESAEHTFYAGYIYAAYAHPAPITNKNIAISRLEGIKSDIPEEDWKKVDEAISKIEESLNSMWWIGPWHVSQGKREKKNMGGLASNESATKGDLTLGGQVPEGLVDLGEKRYGDNVFKKEKGAAKHVKTELLSKKYPPEVIEELLAVEWNIMDADSTLAQVKIVEAELSGGDPAELEKAREAMEKAEKEKEKRRPEYGQVVDFYGKAWHHAVRAEENSSLIQQVQVASIGGSRPVFALGRPYPNPSRSGSCVRYGIAEVCNMSLKIYDISGRLVRTLVDETKSPGYYACEWDGRDERGVSVASGMYIYRFIAGPFSGKRKVVVLK